MTWSIVLAGGKGERLASFTERWLGRYVPKQYCAFVGRRSMLEHTLDRAHRISPAASTLTVVAREHRELASRQVRGRFVEQPVNRDTAAGVFLPLAHVRRRDPEATVVIFPADHFIHPESRFLDTVRVAVEAAEAMPQRLVLLGVAPEAEAVGRDYGWILRGRDLTRVEGKSVRAVRSFMEKPSAELAREASANGGLWNTMVMAGKVETFWRLGWRYVPEVMFRFESLLEAIDTPLEATVTASIYRDMPRKNFSSDLLQRARQEVAVVELDGVHWSDWGRADRIAESLQRLGLRPAWEPTHEHELQTRPFALAGGAA